MQRQPTHPMQVAEVRRCLLAVRTQWAQHDPELPFNLTTIMPNGVQMHTFCFDFVLTHHNKRMQRTRCESKQTELEADGDDYD